MSQYKTKFRCTVCGHVIENVYLSAASGGCGCANNMIIVDTLAGPQVSALDLDNVEVKQVEEADFSNFTY